MDLRKLILNQTDVSLSVAKHVMISTKAKDAILVFSPLSIHFVLGMIAAGSNGPTLDQLLEFLKSKSNEVSNVSSQLASLLLVDGGPLGGPRLSFANGVLVDASLGLHPGFKEIAGNVYKAASCHVDFQTKAVEVAEEVNSWAAQKTNGLIKEILPLGSVNSSTRLVFANALYFKGAWNEKFDASQTIEDEFFLLNGT